MKKVTQAELVQILADHSLYFKTFGKRGQMADLRKVNLKEANLQGAYLIGADLEGANLGPSIRDCYSFDRAKFSPDALPWLILHPKWNEFKDTVQIIEK